VQVLGLSYYLVGRIAESVPLLERARAFAGADPKLAYALGMAYVHTRQVDRARAAWAQAFAQPAESAAACLLNAQLMVRAGFDDLAEEELKRALARDPKLPQVRLLLGQTALFRGRLDEAVTLLDEERRLNPGNATVLDRLGDAYLRLGRWDEAIDVLQRSTWINPYSSNPYILLGRAHLKKSDAGSAEGLLRKAIEYDPNNQAAHYLLGQALQKLGRADEAKREFETAERLPGPVER
jgi:tetratricopeptide (TPR) repeat protein